ncbi:MULTISPECIES: response regulator [unclassified Lentimicrobium]|uniref:hybrid sensor histidine kinase/response regulator n=1 Tax=unclassified Lentimicrobium TaxID=2677434 RepID=UPI00155750F9|nr:MULTISPECIES: response regulator [unclassified Lentimicrobium]NPD45074.1 response regulator [Lentimicrobium sp. S6]NPD84528.1 response regulator [Lentimicrobium sp. L6]
METGQYKVLIVDDVPKNIMVLGNNLLSENYQIAYARSGQEAIDLTLENDFDLILLDIMMPGMDGYETCKHILNNPQTAQIPIIFITAKNDFDSIVKGFDAGAKDYVTKPFNAKELLARVRTHLELKRNRETLEGLNSKLEQKVRDRTLELKKANDKIKQLDSAKSSFLGIISHEIRTPLNGIFGSVEILRDMLKDDDSEDIIEMISESAERLLTFSELSTLITELNIDTYQLSKYIIDLSDVLQEVKEERILKLSNESKVNIHYEDNEKGFFIDADEKLIRKVINDIIHNSIKFNQESVEIHIDINKSDQDIQIQISDDGVGFPSHILENIFEVFHADSEEYVEGKGLNLAAARLILQAHGGNIKAENSKDGGAYVSISIPKSEIG